MPVALGVNGGVLGSNNLPSPGSYKGIWTPNEVARAIALGYWPTLYARAIAESASGADALIASTPAEILEAIIASDLISASGVADEYFEYTTLLLPGNGTNGAQNNTFLDGSTNNFTITRNGNTTQGTFSPFSQTGWGNYFNGSSTNLSVASTTALQFGTGEFTVEAWVYLTATPGAQYAQIIGRTVYGTNADWMLQITNATKLTFYMQGSFIATSTASISLNTWTHVAVSRNSSGQIRLFINGNIDGAATNSGSTENTSSGAYTIGSAQSASTVLLTGYLSNLRAVKGVCVYTGNFTVPTSPLTATQSAGTNISAITGTQTSLLTCQSNRFVDNSVANSGTGFAITVNGSPSVQAFSPFNPTSSWSAATNGGSGYFDGNGDYLTIPVNTAINFGTGNFTVEAWVYPTATPGDGGGPLEGVTGNILFAYQAAGNTWGFGRNNVSWDTLFNQAPILNTWQHIAVSRSGTLLRCFFNGKLTNSATNTNSYILTSGGYVGWNGNAAGYFAGYIANIRTVANAVYTADFTPPTAPLTNITNTSLLLNFTNAGIYDATSKNDLETVGNAQISTTQSKWGGSSMYFPGTSSDFLKIPASRFFNQLYSTSQSFVLEFWIYQTAYGNPSTPLCCNIANVAQGWRLDIDNTGTIRWVSNGANTTATSSISLNVWTYFAFVWDGSKIYVYKNGSLANAGGTTTSWTNTSDNLNIGKAGISGYEFPFTGYLNDVRLTVGTNRSYTGSSITTPTAAFPTL